MVFSAAYDQKGREFHDLNLLELMNELILIHLKTPP